MPTATASIPALYDPVLLTVRHRDRDVKLLALAVALALHVAALFVTIPEFRSEVAEPTRTTVIRVHRYLPPPPQIERSQLPRGPKRDTHRMIPVPDPTPDALEPVREPVPETTGDSLATGEFELLLGEPEGPPGRGPAGPGPQPAIAGVGGVTSPVLIEATRVKPRYPAVARKARLQGRVILRGVVGQDGSVCELETVQSTQPYVGFEEAAIEAVGQWRYEPATLDGEPLAVFFTIVVEFSIS